MAEKGNAGQKMHPVRSILTQGDPLIRIHGAPGLTVSRWPWLGFDRLVWVWSILKAP